MLNEGEHTSMRAKRRRSMNLPTLIRMIYAELRSIAGPDESAAELVRAAADIAAAFLSAKRGNETGATYYTGGTPFEYWTVDRAMADGGWRVLLHESEVVRTLFENESSADEFVVRDWLMENAA